MPLYPRNLEKIDKLTRLKQSPSHQNIHTVFLSLKIKPFCQQGPTHKYSNHSECLTQYMRRILVTATASEPHEDTKTDDFQFFPTI